MKVEIQKISIPKILEEEKTPLVNQLLEIIQQQSEQIQQQAQQIQQQAQKIQILKDEISKLKKLNSKPKIKPSNLDKNTDTDEEKINKKKKKNSSKRSKTKEIEIHETVVIQPDEIPEGSKFKGYSDFIVQDIQIINHNVCYRRAQWETPSGEYVSGNLPNNVSSHFGNNLISFILYQYYSCHVTQPLIYEQLNEFGIDISTGQINNIIIENKEQFHNEKDQILETGLTLSKYINVDDTGARHSGKNGYCTHIGNEYFAWFESTETKSRINFLKLLQGENNDFVINDDSLEYMTRQKFPAYQLSNLSKENGRIFQSDTEWKEYLNSIEITSSKHIRIATEGAMIGSLIYHGFNKDLAIISDDAGQFNVFLHGLCWVHAERHVYKLIGVTEEQEELIKITREKIWDLYKNLKIYKLNPDETKKNELEKEFDALFKKRTGFSELDEVLKRINKNKSELLLVLERPDIPLHNNLSENDIREYVKKRKISGSTRSPTGKRCRDTFTSLKKTCRKLGISFWNYLNDRINCTNNIPLLSDIIASKEKN